MDDAYEIGIRLVLENGVSSGIAALQSDLAAYDRALAATTGRLRMAAGAAQGLVVPARPGAAGPAARGAPPAEEARAPDAAERPAQEQPAVPLAAPSPVSLPPVAPPAPVRPRGNPVAPASAAPAPTVARVAAAPGGAARAVAEPPREPGAPGHRSPPVAVSVSAVPPPPRYARYAPVPPAGGRAAVPEAPMASPVVIAGIERPEMSQAPVGPREISQPAVPESGRAGLEAASMGAPSPVRAPAAPTALAPPAAPVAAAASSGPTQGDVYLDGARVGRWMSDRLARDATRPQAGATGFDSRLGLAGAGSMHGT